MAYNKRRFGSIIFVSRSPVLRDLPASIIVTKYEPVHKKMDTVGNKYTLVVLDDTPWASSTGLAARPSQSFILALLDLSCEPAPGSLPPRVAGTSETSYSEESHFLISKCYPYSILLMSELS